MQTLTMPCSIVPIIEPELKGGDAVKIDFVPMTFFKEGSL